MTSDTQALAVRRVLQAAQQLVKLASAFELVGNDHMANTLGHLADDLLLSANELNRPTS